jgi:YVTN family beta-propeller protein
MARPGDHLRPGRSLSEEPTMKTKILILLAAVALMLGAAGCSDQSAQPTDPTDKAIGLRSINNGSYNGGTVVVANRGSGSISVIDARAAELVGTYMLPQMDGDALPEPMYVNHVKRSGRVFVGDRANDRVAVFDARTFEIEGTVPTGQGVFHQWANSHGDRLWVNNDIDNTVTVIDAVALTVIATIDVPADLVAMGGKPHDVVLDHRGRWAYITVLGIDGPNDYLVQFDADTFEELARQPVGKDPHLAIGVNTDLYVPCQNTDQVLVFDPASLALIDDIAVPGAHGATMSSNNKQFYTTNLPGAGADALYTIGTRRNEISGTPVDTPYPVPHNLVATPDGKKLYVTHSGGTADKVTVYELSRPYGHPTYVGEITVGLNPFGIGYAF